MALANRRAVANRRNREKGNAPAHPSEAELAAGAKPVGQAKPKAARARRPAAKRRKGSRK